MINSNIEHTKVTYMVIGCSNMENDLFPTIKLIKLMKTRND